MNDLPHLGSQPTPYCRKNISGVTFVRYRRLQRLWRSIAAAPDARDYRDVAITPVPDDEEEHLALYEVTDAAKSAVARVRAKSRKPRAATAKLAEVIE